ncbi:riboflavin synthase [Bordetella genomosp. 9]|uniref:Riboflavin synthase n=1 Tax=Bordetella genomosp. 9 TaxID=1416803 RepID=A0A1W6Z3J5_9BORD|nr:riboflavin synthase [Bordetella genomosp. 9]ARP87918.1 riboflavin synthase [Bordetella genomosp. 9]
MFTGIVAAVGRIVQVQPYASADRGGGIRARIDAGNLDLSDVRLGDSIAVQGACMTVVDLHDGGFDIDVSRESLDRTVGLDREGEVNLEKSLRLGDALGGHLVSGHVDGLGQVLRYAPVGESRELVIRAPREMAKYLAYKGSVTVNGISLTVNRVIDAPEGSEITINVIPHTQGATTLRNVKVGDKVNLEIDMIARYVERMMRVSDEAAHSQKR